MWMSLEGHIPTQRTKQLRDSSQILSPFSLCRLNPRLHCGLSENNSQENARQHSSNAAATRPRPRRRAHFHRPSTSPRSAPQAVRFYPGCGISRTCLPPIALATDQPWPCLRSGDLSDDAIARPVEYPRGARDSVPASVIDALRVAGESDADLREVAGVLEMSTACVTVCDGGEGVSLMTWVSSVVALVHGLAPHERAQWEGVLGTLETLAPLGGGIEDGSSAAAEVVGLAELADVALIFGVANRAAPHARDLVGRFYRKSIEQRCFFRDVRMTTGHF